MHISKSKFFLFLSALVVLAGLSVSGVAEARYRHYNFFGPRNRMFFQYPQLWQNPWQQDLYRYDQQYQYPVNPPTPIPPTPSVPASSTQLSATEVIKLVNQARAKQGLGPLVENSKLDASTKMKAEDMLKNQYFSHNTPSGDPSYWTNTVGYNYASFGENLAYGNFKSCEDLMNGWLNSAGHKANIMSSSYTEIGVSVIKGNYNGREVWMAVQHFGKPR
jgi:uncharacterized protein YkwD